MSKFQRYKERAAELGMRLLSAIPPGPCGQSIPGPPWMLAVEMDGDVFDQVERCWAACKGLNLAAGETESVLSELARLRSRAAEAHQWEEMAERTGLPLKPDGAEAEIARLREIESQAKAAGFIGPDGKVRKRTGPLPVTADNVIASLFTALWHPFEEHEGYIETEGDEYVVMFSTYHKSDGTTEWTTYSPDLCYSTREAAEAAREANQ